jgi:SAM-dependent methyltransferase
MNMLLSRKQSLANLEGEITFRAKLARQHVSGEVLLPDYYQRRDHDRILLERVNATRKTMQVLANKGIRLSPFLELGAERGQRSLVLRNDFFAEGVAIDISYHQLRTMEHFATLFRREKLPLRICCDANHLPFKSNSFPFIFCYGFLHHFPSLGPIMQEIYRVLGNGYFYFDEEPFKRVLKVSLYTQRSKIYSETRRTRNKYLGLIEDFISAPNCDEVEHGIIENNDISIMEWLNTLCAFEEQDVNLSSMNTISSKLGKKLHLRNLANFLLGGNIAGLCHKKTPVLTTEGKITELLGCPDCTIPTDCVNFDRPSLLRACDGFHCPRCGYLYPCKDDILFLLPKAELEQLYSGLRTQKRRDS